ncbi:endolytic transglycosylase MltG [Ideonella livida]|uniref:Endolytic murein transglycosylase n=1 Tax=Ideonella livida TaxID=2707176 RepID=A0A7C9TKS6_9BURK|nr:endolytic transglycosylase MltG [Ideonella livida]NDY90526.1 endolytic transglycosylase MltG [Ideonella livida]
MKVVKRLVWTLLGLALGLGALLAAWVHSPLPLRQAQVEVSIEPGTSPRDVARLWVGAGVEVPEVVLYQWFRLSGQARRIRAGSYEVETGVTPRTLLERMVRGDESLETVRFIEGWSFRQVREALARAPHLRPTLAALSDAEVARLLELPLARPEGWVFPDTYAYSRGVSDVTVLRRARDAMRRRLEGVWAERAQGVPLRSPQELLVLASIVEKETGAAADRGRIAGVFANRLRLGMPLQSDPTVIYGMGERFDGNLRRTDLQTDTPWNTYTRTGLPPTPIAMPGLQALQAAARPEATDALYFVAMGDGRSAFSANLDDHNRAVNRYQRGGR